ncbi:TPA: hypothetical protein QEM79_002296 [Pseudomonas putida]|uniref:hypothetical protein n=1 Tax=Pseudomonas juntendi TaxID=2666183 RepID=UPI001FFDAEC7|nr:hypothetical protein [Pseudomonas juntendi]MCK2109199.1 hypothetical protein [Pseudomonas juntendi]MCK2118117.1 hypothetical protein [Pseudomonas juntendi]HDS1811557.1 hypothetical protein [Pseudomonas putida]HDS3808152.1 hypothetical protein [Pseudomonas putida]
MEGITGFKMADGITVIRSTTLPNKTMYVSADVYDLLTQGPEEVDRQHAELMARAEQFSDIVRRAKEKR